MNVSKCGVQESVSCAHRTDDRTWNGQKMSMHRTARRDNILMSIAPTVSLSSLVRLPPAREDIGVLGHIERVYISNRTSYHNTPLDLDPGVTMKRCGCHTSLRSHLSF